MNLLASGIGRSGFPLRPWGVLGVPGRSLGGPWVDRSRPLGIAVSGTDSFVMYTACFMWFSVVCSGVAGLNGARLSVLDGLTQRSRRRPAEG